MPIRRAVLMTRQAISPRLAIRMRLNMRRVTLSEPERFSAAPRLAGLGHESQQVGLSLRGVRSTPKQSPAGWGLLRGVYSWARRRRDPRARNDAVRGLRRQLASGRAALPMRRDPLENADVGRVVAGR